MAATQGEKRVFRKQGGMERSAAERRRLHRQRDRCQPSTSKRLMAAMAVLCQLMYAGPAPNRREVLKIMYVRERGERT